jgi:DNA-directed RNA polymerase I subunit RPA1
METALTAKQRQFNLSKGLDRPSIAVVKRMTDRLKRERESGVLEEEEEDEDEDVQMADAPAHDVLAKDAPAKDAPAPRSRSPPGRERDATPSESGDSEGDDLMQVDESGPLVYDARLPKPAKKKQAPKGEKKPREKQAERFVSAEELRANIRLLFAKESNLMNSIYGMHSHNGKTRRIADPDMFFIDTICVPPVRFRPAALLNGVAMENPQNELLGNILASAIRIGERSAALKEMQKKPEAESSEAAASRVLDANKAYVSLLDSITMLQHSVNSLIDSSKNPTRLKGGKQNPDGIKQVLEKKEGLFRMNMMVRLGSHFSFG